MVKNILLLLLITMNSRCFSQDKIRRGISYLQQFQKEDFNYEIVQEQLAEYLETPLFINKCESSDLEKFPLFSFHHVNVLNQYRRQNENILSAIELASLPYFDQDFIEVIKPFINFSRTQKKEMQTGYILLRNQFQLEKSAGVQLQDSMTTHQLLKVKYQIGNLMIKLNAEKDRFESWNESANFPKIGFQYKKENYLKQINIGTFRLHLPGSILNLQNNFASQANHSNYSVSINSSSIESNFKNGAALLFKHKKYQSIMSFSTVPVHGVLNSDTLYSLKTDGLFQTDLDREKKLKSRITELTICNKIKIKKVYFAVQHQVSSISHPLTFDKKIPQTQLFNSLQLNWEKNNLQLNTEFFHLNNNIGSNSSLSHQFLEHWQSTTTFKIFKDNLTFNFISSNTPKYDFSHIIRYSTYTQAFSIYYSQKYYIDGISFQKKQEVRLQHTFLYQDSLNFEINLRLKNNMTDSSSEKLSLFSLKARWKHMHLLTGTSKISLNYFENKIGTSFQQDLKLILSPINLHLRYAITNCPTWEQRFYTYENDLLFNFSFPVYYDYMQRFYLMTSFKPSRKTQLEFKIGRSFFPKKTTLGTGIEKIATNHRTIIKLQFQIRF